MYGTKILEKSGISKQTQKKEAKNKRGQRQLLGNCVWLSGRIQRLLITMKQNKQKRKEKMKQNKTSACKGAPDYNENKTKKKTKK